MVLVFAFAIALVVGLPWVAASRFVGAVVTYVVAFVFALIFVYFATPSISPVPYGEAWG